MSATPAYLLHVGEKEIVTLLPRGDKRRETFDRWLLVRRDDVDRERQAYLFVDPALSPTNDTFWRANAALFGPGGYVELYRPDGVRVWP